MKHVLSLGVLSLAALFAGCIPLSLQPLYSEDAPVFEPELVGAWVATDSDSDATDGWFFVSGDQATYQLVIREGGKANPMQARLVRIGESLFLDMFPGEVDLGDVNQPGLQLGDYYRLQLVSMHSFVRIDAIGPELRISPADFEELNRLLSEEPEAIARHEVPADTDLHFFTATPEELREWVALHEKTLFDSEKAKPIVLKRRGEKTPAPE